MARNKKSIFTVLLAITFCGNEAFGVGEEVDRPSHTVGSRLGTAPIHKSDRRWEIIDFNATDNAILIGSIKVNDTWVPCEMVSSDTHRVNEYIAKWDIKASQVTRMPFSPQILERPEFVPYREDILKASATPKRTISGSSSYNISSTSTKTINGRTVTQGGRKISTNSSKAKVIKCADGRAVVISGINSEVRGPGAYNKKGDSRTNVVRIGEVTPEYLTKLGVQPSDVAWENSPDSSDNVALQSVLTGVPMVRNGVAKSPASRVMSASSPTKPVARITPLRSTVGAPTLKPQVGKQIQAMKPSIPARAALQPARPQRAMAASGVGRRVGISSSAGVRGVPVRTANGNPQKIQRRAALPLTRRTSVTSRPQVVRKPAPAASSRRVSVVPQRKTVTSVLRQAPVRNTSLRVPMRAPITGRRPANSRLP